MLRYFNDYFIKGPSSVDITYQTLAYFSSSSFTLLGDTQPTDLSVFVQALGLIGSP